MSACPRCGSSENTEDAHFCACGAFLDWDAPAEEPVARPAPGGAATATAAVAPGTSDHVAVRLAGPGDGPEGAAPVLAVAPGGRVTVAARVRNLSSIVDSFRVEVEGLPDAWWTIDPPTPYLLPLGSREGDEEEVTIALHPPRTPAATAGRWRFAVVATSESHPTRLALAEAFLDVEPFWEIGARARPEIVAGRRGAALEADVRSSANTPVPVTVSGVDSEELCRVDAPPEPVRVQPGETRAVPLAIVPLRRHWFGRPRDRRLELAARADHDDLELVAPFAAVFRQRPWIPWWLPLVILLALIAALVAWLVWPQRTTVPDLRGVPSAFEAQKRLEEAELTLDPQVRSVPRPKARPGSVIDQAPAAGERVEEGREVAVVVAAGRGKVRVPKLAGLRVSAADERLQKAGLTLGAVQPKLDPKGKVGSQVPRPGTERPRGAPVNVVLAKPRKDEEKKEKKDEDGGGGKEGGGAASAVPPVPAGGGEGAAKAAIEKAGLTPVTRFRIDPAKRGTVLGTDPPKGGKPPADDKVVLIVSAGFPRLSFDNPSGAFAAGGVAGSPLTGIARRGSLTAGGAWAADGRRVAYVLRGQLFVAQAGGGMRGHAIDLGRGRVAAEAAFAPRAPLRGRTTLAAVDRGGARDGDAVCWLELRGVRRATRPRCRGLAGWRLDGLAWASDGKSLLAPASGRERFGIVRLETRRPFSSDPDQWSGGQHLVTRAEPGRGVLAAAPEPGGERVALVSNLASDDFRVALAPADDLATEKPDLLPLQGCEVAWRQDARELAVVQSGPTCRERTGPLVRVRPAAPRALQTVVMRAGNPAWQPIDLSPGPGR